MMTKTKIYLLCLSFVSIGNFACRSDKKFAGKTDAGDAAQSATRDDNSSDVNGSGGSTTRSGPVAACDKNSIGITQTKLLSKGISTTLGTQTLTYELSVVNCKDGSIESLKDQPILFDLDASLAQGFQAISYEILDSANTSVLKDMLQVVSGSDLFGNTGNFAHWTTQNLSYSSKLEKLTLQIKLENMQVLPRDASKTSIDSYLRIGNAQAVTQPLAIIN